MIKKIAQVACALAVLLGISSCSKKSEIDYEPITASGNGAGGYIFISLENSQGESLLGSAQIMGRGLESGRALMFDTPSSSEWTGLQTTIRTLVESPNERAYTKELEALANNGQEDKSIELPSRIQLTVNGQSLEAKVVFLFSYRVPASGEIPYGLSSLRIVRIEVGEKVVAQEENGSKILLRLVKGADGKLSVK